MENNANKKEELNYKQAYCHLFKKVTEVIWKLETFQREAEEICTDDSPNPKTNDDKLVETCIDIFFDDDASDYLANRTQ